MNPLMARPRTETRGGQRSAFVGGRREYPVESWQVNANESPGPSGLRGPDLDLLPLDGESDSLGLRQVLHNRLWDCGRESPDLVIADPHGELLGSLLPLGHTNEPYYLSVYGIRYTPIISVDTVTPYISVDMSCVMYAKAGPEYDKRLVRAREIASHAEEIESLNIAS